LINSIAHQKRLACRTGWRPTAKWIPFQKYRTKDRRPITGHTLHTAKYAGTRFIFYGLIKIPMAENVSSAAPAPTHVRMRSAGQKPLQRFKNTRQEQHHESIISTPTVGLADS